MLPTGQRLRALREQLGLTMRDVEAASARIAARHGNEDFAISISRLSDIEAKGVLPNLLRLYSLSVIYRRDIGEVLSWCGIDVNEAAADLVLVDPPKSHLAECFGAVQAVNVPIRMDPGFDPRRTVNLSRMIERWGLVPVNYLSQFAQSKYTYGYIGSEDFTMYPLLLPGSFIEVDESVNTVIEGNWHSEYERPVYFMETRQGYTACWCGLKGDSLVLQPHPLSPVAVRMLKHPQEAEIRGRVVGVAMRLNDWRPVPSGKSGLGEK